VAKSVSLPIVAMGGIATGEDAIEFILAGATGVAVGTTNFYNPYATMEVIEGIEKYMKEYGILNISELIGLVE